MITYQDTDCHHLRPHLIADGHSDIGGNAHPDHTHSHRDQRYHTVSRVLPDIVPGPHLAHIGLSQIFSAENNSHQAHGFQKTGIAPFQLKQPNLTGQEINSGEIRGSSSTITKLCDQKVVFHN